VGYDGALSRARRSRGGAEARLQFIPFYGWYITKAGSIAIDRSGRGAALRKMIYAAKRVIAEGRSI